MTSLARSLIRVLVSFPLSNLKTSEKGNAMLTSRSMFVGGIDFDSDDNGNDTDDGEDRDEFVDDNLKDI